MFLKKLNHNFVPKLKKELKTIGNIPTLLAEVCTRRAGLGGGAPSAMQVCPI